MRVLIADNFETSGREGLAALGCEVHFQPKLKDQELVNAIRELRPDVLVKLVVRAGAGYNTIDVPAATQRGVCVSNCPGKNSIAVAELAFGLILSLDRRIPDNVATLRAEQWNKAEYSKAKGLFGRTLGLIGVGQIGGHMVTRAQAFGMHVVGCDPVLTLQRAKELGIELKATPPEVAAAADIVSIHLPLVKETRGMINAAFFNAMRPGACFINTSRGEVVDQAALVAAMHEKGIRAGLDVYAAEPETGAAPFTDPIAKEPNLYGTHHIGASTEQAQEAVAAETVRIIKSFKETGQVPNAVNKVG
jgi:D-3-phosphoglycerate dehydrogenase